MNKNNKKYVQIEIGDYIQSLEQRYEEVKDRWAGEAEEELFPLFLDLIEDTSEGCPVESPSIVVDNFLINGQFAAKENFKEEGWSYETWEELCANALIYNDDYACLSA